MEQLRFEGAGQGEDTFTVGQLNALIDGVVSRGLPDEVWVRGEVQSLSRSKTGHTYFELIEKAPGDRWPRGRLSVALLAAEREWINAQLVDVPDFRVQNGIELRIRGRIRYHGGTGKLSLLMTGVDPIFTLGALAAQRDRVLRHLAEEGLLEANRALLLPPVPLAIGLVTSIESAAYNDFVRELHDSGFGFRVFVVDARVQGQHAAPMVIRALRTLRSHGVDLIAVVRGGGSTADLAAFDDERIARAIAGSDVAVLTGIGHEVDTTVADHVAHASFKTPTACARAIVEQVRAYRQRMEAAWHAVATRTTRLLDRRAATVDQAGRRVAAAASGAVRLGEHRVDEALRAVSAPRLHTLLARQTDRLEVSARRVALAAPRPLAAEARHLDGLAARLRLLDPAATMQRGWSITRRADGTVVRHVTDVAPGEVLVTTLADGTAHSRVERIVPTEEPA